MTDRRSIVTLAVKGPFTGKPRPWVVVQNDDFREIDSVTLCAFTHILVPGAPMLRIDVEPSEVNGLRLRSQIQVDKIVTVRRGDLGEAVGRLEDRHMTRLCDALRYFLAL